MASKNIYYIFFYEINTLNLLNKINYYNRFNELALLNKNYLIVCSLSGSLNRFNLINIDTREMFQYFCSDEEEYKKIQALNLILMKILKNPIIYQMVQSY